MDYLTKMASCQCIDAYVAALRSAPLSLLVLGGLGTVVVLKYALDLAKLIFNLTLRGGINIKKFGAGTGAWAVITGASDGIGKEFALQLAQAKYNVVLSARTESKLNTLASEIASKYNVETKVVPFDYSHATSADYENLGAQLAPLKVTILVNNVGTNHEFPVSFVEENPAVIESIVNVNIKSVMAVTRLIAPKMVVQQQGLILNVGSFAGLMPQPLLSVYSASKAYLLTWSQAVGRELAPHKVHVQCLSTYFVVSAMSKIRKSSWTIPTAHEYVRAALHRLGNPGGASTPYTSSPYSAHAIMNWVIDRVGSPSFWVNKAYATQASIRKRALAKKAREADKKDN
ncbi:hypothetical protein GGF31_002953 [Allomyces arbusculus]|nr:hypothetical protein GGF31_002953 [Allomyces arbusculus]